MSVTARTRAEAAQRAASDPAVSAFVAASAGSGKTKLLTDRLVRLMLAGADPARILCLTFTKAAAAEMAVRLQRLLGRWVTLPDDGLAAELRALDVAPARAAEARALFARVLDLPGGMRIGTIHSFCEQVLRRFPLEAQLSPHFRVLEDADARALRDQSIDSVLASALSLGVRDAVCRLAAVTDTRGFATAAAELRRDRARLAAALERGQPALLDTLRAHLGAEGTPEDAAAALLAVPEEAQLAASLRAALAHKKIKDQTRERAEGMLAWLALPPPARAARWQIWWHCFFTQEHTPAKNLLNKDLCAAFPDLLAALQAEQARLETAQAARRAVLAADASSALLEVALRVHAAIDRAKGLTGRLDFDDLIARSARLLVDPGAAWVLYKLDGGIDHLLLDEVQDTAPAQWQIAGAITGEFFAGAGARAPDGSPARTVFAVGDRKQSIYGFQGADPDGFETWRATLRARAQAAGPDGPGSRHALSWHDGTLDVSFRSTAPVLALVDATFAEGAARAGVVDTGEMLRHVANRAGHAGRVELWPLVEAPEPDAPEPWQAPDRNLSAATAPALLAQHLADWIAAATSGGDRLDSRARPLAPGDILVLVRRRNAFADQLVRELKRRAVPVAGLDRMVLTDQPAVADLLALGDALLLPQDDLQLACVLTSPLGGLSDASLMALAAERPGTLWNELLRRGPERPDWLAARAFLAALFARVDYAAPYDLFAEALGPLGGRARLLARMGPQAAEPLDEFLALALADAQAHPPSLQGFLHRLRRSGAEVKREPEGMGGAVRIMTVHGAKGLQAPVVILPDTTALPPEEHRLMWDVAADGRPLPLWVPRKDLGCAVTDTLRERLSARQAAEHNRLLYVALTRAEDRLIVCGWQPGRKLRGTCWYELVKAGFARLPDVRAETDGRLVAECPQTVPPEPQAAARATQPPPLPGWAGLAPRWQPSPPPPEPALPRPLAPSRPEGITWGTLPAARSPLGVRGPAGGASPGSVRRGTLIHALLQHLPGVPPDARAAAAIRFLSAPAHGLSSNDAEAMAHEVLGVLAHPALAPLFGPAGRSEVPMTGVVDGRIIGGVVDRLAVLPDQVIVADYKTARSPPRAVHDTPVAFLRQMAAYRALVSAIHPDRPVRCALVWTLTAEVHDLPGELLERHAPGAGMVA